MDTYCWFGNFGTETLCSTINFSWYNNGNVIHTIVMLFLLTSGIGPSHFRVPQVALSAQDTYEL